MSEIIQEMVKDLQSHPYCALDTETTGVHFLDTPFSFQLKTQNHELYSEDFSLLDQLKDLDVTWFMHNATFDLVMLRKKGIQFKGTVHCTMSMDRLLYNKHLRYNLDSVSSRYNLPKKDDEVKKYIRKHKLYRMERGDKVPCYYDVPRDMLMEYGLQDVRITYAVGTKQLEELERDELYYNEVKLTRVCEDMEWRGIPVDTQYCEQAITYHEDLRDRALQEFREATGDEFVDSNKSIAKYIPEQYAGVSKKGNPSYDRLNLRNCPLPIAKTIDTIREHNHVLKNFYGNILKYQVDGVVHPRVNRASTVTGRLSYADPNLQNFPKDEDWQGKKHLVRKAIVPPEGFELVAVDFDQQEFRVLLDYAGETKLIEQINAGADVHQATADLVGVDRKPAKAIGFGLLYGLGLKNLSLNLGKSVEETRYLRNMFFQRLPKVKRLVDQIKRVAETRGYIKNWAGRKYYLDDPRFSYRMTNYLIQGGCADIMRYALVRCKEQESENLYPMISVHDEIVFCKRIGHDDSEINKMREIMESVYVAQNNVRLTTSLERSTVSWGQCDMEE